MKLKATELKQYKEKLLKLRADLSDEIGRIKDGALNKSTRDSSGDLSGYSLHMADQASDNFEREFSLDLAQNEQGMIYRIDAALKRIEEKSFGECVSCQKAISKQRLKAVPYAEACIACQEAQEKSPRAPRRR
jgi:RNA polymerase-binding protein DksA